MVDNQRFDSSMTAQDVFERTPKGKAQRFLSDERFRKQTVRDLSLEPEKEKRRQQILGISPLQEGPIRTPGRGGGDEGSSQALSSEEGEHALPEAHVRSGLAGALRTRQELQQLPPERRTAILDAATAEQRQWQADVDEENQRRRKTGTGFFRPQPQEPAVVFPERLPLPAALNQIEHPATENREPAGEGSSTLKRLAEQKRAVVPQALAHEEGQWTGVPASESASEREQRIPFTVWGIASTGTGFERRALIEGGGLMLDLPKALGSGRILVAALPGAPDNVVRFEVSFTKDRAPASLRGAPLGDTEIMVTPMTKNAYAERKAVDSRRGTNTLVKEVTVTLPKGMTWEHLRPLFGQRASAHDLFHQAVGDKASVADNVG